MTHRDFASINRRRFLELGTAAGASLALPGWFIEQLAGQTQPAAPKSANDRPALALVGCGGRGMGVAQEASQFGRVVAVCDLDDRHLAEAQKMWPEATPHKDFRRVMEDKRIDAVICGTVDHWHVLVSTAAMRAGKDVYCEKPLTLTIAEGRHLVRARAESQRVLQTGSQQRSDPRFRLACELVRNGRIGKVERVKVFLPAGRREGPFSTAPIPEGFDWEMWQGPTPKVEYVPERTHLTFRYWWEYSGGTMTDWGAHHNDIALWGLGLERSGPVEISGEPLVTMIPDGFSAVSEYRVTYRYANGVIHSCESTAANAWNGAVVDPKGQQHGVRFEGTDGWIWVTRGAIDASDKALLDEPLPSTAERLYVSNNHMGNFFECLRSRSAPICEPEIGHRSASICHLGVIALRLGRLLRWDPEKEQFQGDDEANSWVSRPMREPWTLDAV